MAVWLNFKKMVHELYACHMARSEFIMHVCTLLQKYGVGRGVKTDKNMRDIRLIDKRLEQFGQQQQQEIE